MQQSNVSLVIAFRMGDHHVVGTHAAPPHWQAQEAKVKATTNRYLNAVGWSVGDYPLGNGYYPSGYLVSFFLSQVR